MTVNSFAKLNLFLKVLRRRADGYHTISTVFERISLKDTIILKNRRDAAIRVTTNAKGLACDSSNLAFRSALILQKTYCRDKGVDIHIAKQIPLGSGMGGGSSNAASVLMGLNKLWGLRLSRKKLSRVGARIGSDVPFFIYDTAFALGSSRGERIEPLTCIGKVKLWHVIVVPKINVSTDLIYKAWDGLKSLGLTRNKSSAKLTISALKRNDPLLLTRVISNSLEPVTESLYPQIRRVKDALFKRGAKSIMMSGSGPAVFSIISSRKEAVGLRKQLVKKHHVWNVYLARTISR